MIHRLDMMSRSWSRSSRPTLAHVAIALALCIDMVRGQSNYTVGSGFISGSIWTNTVNGLVQPTILENEYKQWAASVNITVGDTLIFNYERAAHTVYRLKSADDFANCVSTTAERVTDGAPTTYTVQASDLPVVYFICNIAGHCEGGQKLAISPLINSTAAPITAPSTTSAAHQLALSTGLLFTLLAATSYLALVTQLSP